MDLSSYVTVPERIAQFREKYPEGCLQPVDLSNPYSIQEIGGKVFIVYAAAAYRGKDDTCPGIGVAWEPFPGRTPYTRDSELMNAETSAWGRAIVAVLAADTSRGIATQEEVRNREEDRVSGESPGSAHKPRSRKTAEPPLPAEKNDIEVFVKMAENAKTRDELNAAWKAAGASGQLNDTFEHHGEIVTFKDFLYRRHDELAHKSGDGDADPDIRHSSGDQR